MKAGCFHSGPPILCVIPFARGDAKQAITLLEWIRDLGGCQRNPCLLVSANNTWPDDKKSITALAEQCFAKVDHVSPPRPLPDESWPRGANWLFKHAAEWIERNARRPFWWNEPDCIPLCDGWLDYLEHEYYKTKKPFLGTAGSKIELNGRTIGPMVNGGCLYPYNTASRFQAFDYTSNEPWDVWMSPRILKDTHNSKLVQHFFGQMGMPPTFRERHVRGEPENTFTLEQIKPGAVVFHRNKDGTLIDLLRDRAGLVIKKPQASFYHSGDLGDIVYSLPTVISLGGGAYYVGPDNRSGHGTRVIMNQQRAASIVPLLESQPFISEASFRGSMPTGVIDLNDFRKDLIKSPGLDFTPGYNLARVVLRRWSLPMENDLTPWLTAEPNPKAKVLVSRSERYHEPKFRWELVIEKYRADLAFVGTPSEYHQFCSYFGKVPYLPTKDLLELAQLISGCDLFVGNQSCPYSIAVGLGKAAVLEVCSFVPNCIFKRPNIIHGCSVETILPDV